MLLFAFLGVASSHVAVGQLLLDTTQCMVSECAVGYAGTGSDTCVPGDGAQTGSFALSGCAPLCVVPSSTTGYVTSLCDTTNAAITASACTLSCESGYRNSGNGPAAVCSEGFGTFLFSGCEEIPKCTLPSSTVGYITTGCAAFTAAITEDQCSVSCDSTSGYGGTGADACGSGGGQFVLSGCTNACSLPSDTTGYATSGCSGIRTSAQCTVTCDTGFSGTALDSCSAPGGSHSFSGCTAAPKCVLPSDTTGYTVSGCNNVYESQCSVTCASGYSGTGVDTCGSDGAEFSFTGCNVIPKCTLPSSTTGYTPTSCDNTFESQCSVQCADGYTGTATDTCSNDGGEFVFNGCSPIPRCSAAATTGYTTTPGCDTSSGNLLEAQCTATCATSYGGTAVETCSTDGGNFVFSGCAPECRLPSTIPTGYIAVLCSGTILESQCTVACDNQNNYAGTAAVTCTQAGGNFAMTGCTLTPKCSLPETTPGYLTAGCNPGRLNLYGIYSSECTVACAAGYSGTGVATCLSDGGTFELTGCTRDSTCSLLFADSQGYKTTHCATPLCDTNPIDETSCMVECDTGYTGIAVDSCPDALTGELTSQFELTGCVPMCVHPPMTTGYVTTGCNTATAAITSAECVLTCEPGYRSTGSGPTATCNTGYGFFEFSGCEIIPSCSLPTSTTGYITTNCAATTSATLTEAQCTVTCDTGRGYGGSAADACSVDGGSFALTGCAPACTLPTITTGYVTSGCTGTKISSQCTVSCAENYEGTGADACTTTNGKHVLSGCSQMPKCTLPSDTTGYTATDCSNTYETQCSVQCAAGFGGTAVDTCNEDGAAFSFSGCTLIPKCTLPASTTGYVPTDCENTYASQCSVQCASDYVGTAADACNNDGSAFVFSGCTAVPKCTASATTGYTLTSCNSDGGSILESQCTATCADNYAGTAVDSCLSDGGAFTFTGCNPECTLPSVMPAGYVATSCAGTILASACSVTCDSGYFGTALPLCASAGGTFTFSGCTAIFKCTLPTVSPGYITSACNTGRGSSYGITAVDCSVSCAPGFSGTGSALCPSDGGEFALTGCARDNLCSLPTSTTGYLTTMCATHAGDCPASTTPNAVVDGPSFALGAKPTVWLLLLLALLLRSS
mmetsp:Transcript_36275/g.85118  ORF Transcript_36275/g.85118 Transcript_36275/m.85118 type:complete len:1132 (-) Transcript_36275:294-3689(-)